MLSDEIYSRLTYDRAEGAVSIYSLPNMKERVVLVDGFSKTYCMTGWRLGWAVMPEALARRTELLAVHSYGCVATFTQEAGVAALKWIPLGGLYITGGLTPKNLSLLKGEKSLFMQAFRDKGRLSPLLKRVPVYAVLAEDIGQRGAHLVAFRLMKSSAPKAEPADIPVVKR